MGEEGWVWGRMGRVGDKGWGWGGGVAEGRGLGFILGGNVTVRQTDHLPLCIAEVKNK